MSSSMQAELSRIRDAEYPLLQEHTYLDHAAATIYAESVVRDFAVDLTTNLYGNPHSASALSELATNKISTIRERALRFFSADPKEFDLIFVANATSAVKLVAESIHDYSIASKKQLWYGFHRDSHTSVVGVRGLAHRHQCFTGDEKVEEWIRKGSRRWRRHTGLFAYPAQSNMTGRRLPLSWSKDVREAFHGKTLTLLDAAGLVGTAPLDLSDPSIAPDFVVLSFHKMFGFPDLGGLIVRKQSTSHLWAHRRYFGGGTVDMVITLDESWIARKAASVHDQLEDGTLPFHSIIALDHAINVHCRLYGPSPMIRISHYLSGLSKTLFDRLSTLRHSNGTPVCRIYKDSSSTYGNPATQGPTVAFNIQRGDKSFIGFRDVEEGAIRRGISLRSGSLCNPGGMATYLNWAGLEMHKAFEEGHTCSSPHQILLDKPTGVVRASLGAMSTTGDVDRLVTFLDSVYTERSIKSANNVTSITEMATLALEYFKQEQWDAAEACEAKVLNGRRRVLGDRHPLTQISFDNIREIDRMRGLHLESYMEF